LTKEKELKEKLYQAKLSLILMEMSGRSESKEATKIKNFIPVIEKSIEDSRKDLR